MDINFLGLSPLKPIDVQNEFFARLTHTKRLPERHKKRNATGKIIGYNGAARGKNWIKKTVPKLIQKIDCIAQIAPYISTLKGGALRRLMVSRIFSSSLRTL